jgi:hypothetical protein
MKFFYEKLTLEHNVDVLKLGKVNNFSSKIKSIDERLFTSFILARINRGKISNLLAPILKQYDLILVSTPPYNLCEIAIAAKRANVRYILDLRDQPDLITSEQKRGKLPLWLSLKLWITEQYLINTAKYSLALLCVGSISTALMQQKLSRHSTKVINVHNGFNLLDKQIVRDSAPFTPSFFSEKLIIGCVGSLYNFRDTTDLRKVLRHLNEREGGATLRHWGKIGAALYEFLWHLPNIRYIECPSIPREELLQELHSVDCFLLACSDDLIWEPTTSVFDYILFDKPVIFTGLRNNEAFCILENTGVRIVDSDSLSMLTSEICSPKEKKSESVLANYSRETTFTRLKKVIDTQEKILN